MRSTAGRPVVVDAHVHVWTADYPWLAGAPEVLRRTYDGEDLRRATTATGPGRAADSGGIEATASLEDPDAVVLVQACDAAFDTEVMAAAAAAVPNVVGLVVWVPLDRPDDVAAPLTAAREQAGAAPVVGVRTLQHDRPDPTWITQPATLAGLREVAAAGLPYDYVTASPELLTRVPAVLGAAPGLRLVLDHLGKPPVGLGADCAAMRRWRELLRAAAASGDVVAKLSGLYPAAGVGAASVDELRVVVEIALAELGPERLMLGSDWPMTETAGGRSTVTSRLTAAVRASLVGDEAALAAVFGGTAQRVYGLRFGTSANVFGFSANSHARREP